MSMIEVDPKLFITCRLCLEDTGHYQIVPAVREQIKYCFDIDVEPFDGLPQLICRKCEKILYGYYKNKKTFIDKQNELKIKIGEKKVKPEQPQQETVSSSQQYDDEIVSSNKVVTSKKRKAHILSTSSNALSAVSDISLNRNVNMKVESYSFWELDYNKYYVCKLCSRQFKNERSLKNHRTIHNSLKEKYHYVFNKNCMLKLEKLDGKPNMTGRNTVVHNNAKIIEDGDLDCYIMYLSKQLDNDLEQNNYEASDDSEEDFFIKKKRSKKRLISKSSNDTVVIEPHNDDSRSEVDDEKPFNEVQMKIPDKSECINIDDSSDSSSDKNHKKEDSQSTVSRKNINAKFNDYKTIQNIISMCHAKYEKRLDVQRQNKKAGDTINSEPQLKRKILSIGRKVVNRQTLFNCTGLIRFMEHKNLELKWVPKTLLNCSKDTYYIRIMTKTKTNMTDNSELTGWTNLSSVVLKQNVNLPTPCSAMNIQSNENVSIDASDHGVVYNDTNLSNVDHKNKLLNANPVANPKQLPKKTITIELTPNITISTIHNTPNMTLTPITFENTVENVDDGCMPIITSTTSLAHVENDTDKKDNGVTVGTEDCETMHCVLPNTVINTPMPRIKVKPVSELLSKEVLKNMLCDNTTTNCVVNQDQQRNVIYTQQETINNIPGMVDQNPVSQLKIVHVQGAADTCPIEKATTPVSGTVANNEYVILDTVELPNTKTRSPFKYLTNLLQIHNITLLDTKETLSPESICLIKFKVLYKQETKDQPVILCLSLFSLKNTFCIKVKDRNQDNIDMGLISANWQWEIIKIFKGDVVQKLLQNAQKASQEVYEYTKSFLCLIKSINFMKEP